MSLQHLGLSKVVMRTIAFIMFMALSMASCCGGCNNGTSTGGNGSQSPTTTPPCNPLCNLGQSGTSFIGKVQSANQAANSSAGGGSLTARDTQYIVTVDLPPGSSPGTNDQLTLIINNLQTPPSPGDFIRVVAVPNNDANQTFTALSVKPASQQDFQDQRIEYLGTETE